MAFARFGRDSDVYVYEDTDGGFVCERCPAVGQEYRCQKAAEMVTHLLEHRNRGQRVPEDAMEELRSEANSTR